MTWLLILVLTFSFGVLLAIVWMSFLWARKVKGNKQREAEFYGKYRPPVGKDAVEDRRQIAAKAKQDHPEMNRKERQGAARQVQSVMRNRAAFHKAKADG